MLHSPGDVVYYKHSPSPIIVVCYTTITLPLDKKMEVIVGRNAYGRTVNYNPNLLRDKPWPKTTRTTKSCTTSTPPDCSASTATYAGA